MGRSSFHWQCRGPWGSNRIVTAYVRLGTPSRWKKVGKVCVGCGAFWPDLPEVLKR